MSTHFLPSKIQGRIKLEKKINLEQFVRIKIIVVYLIIHSHQKKIKMKKIQSIGVILSFVFPVCLFITILCSDYQTENEHRLYVEIQEFFVNWYTFTTTLIGMLLVSISWIKVPQKRKRPTTF